MTTRELVYKSHNGFNSAVNEALDAPIDEIFQSIAMFAIYAVCYVSLLYLVGLLKEDKND